MNHPNPWIRQNTITPNVAGADWPRRYPRGVPIDWVAIDHVGLTPGEGQGQWVTLADGTRVWQRIRIPLDAKALRRAIFKRRAIKAAKYAAIGGVALLAVKLILL